MHPICVCLQSSYALISSAGDDTINCMSVSDNADNVQLADDCYTVDLDNNHQTPLDITAMKLTLCVGTEYNILVSCHKITLKPKTETEMKLKKILVKSETKSDNTSYNPNPNNIPMSCLLITLDALPVFVSTG